MEATQRKVRDRMARMCLCVCVMYSIYIYTPFKMLAVEPTAGVPRELVSRVLPNADEASTHSLKWKYALK